ncbi:hypothetical protein TWF281_006692 [Arthrobotrys megalospora]
MLISTRCLVTVLGLYYTAPVDAWAYFWWKDSLGERGINRNGDKVYDPPGKCWGVYRDTNLSYGWTITQFGEKDYRRAPTKARETSQWLDPVRYIGFWLNPKEQERCLGLPDLILRYYPELEYTKQSFNFQNLENYVDWVKGGEYGEFQYWGEIPFGDMYFPLEGGDVAIRSSKPQLAEGPSYEGDYLVIQNGIAVTNSQSGRMIQRDNQLQNTGRGMFTKNIRLTFPPAVPVTSRLTGREGDRNREVELGLVPETYPFAIPQPGTNVPGTGTSEQRNQVEGTGGLDRQRLIEMLSGIRTIQQQQLDRVERERTGEENQLLQKQELKQEQEQEPKQEYLPPASQNEILRPVNSNMGTGINTRPIPTWPSPRNKYRRLPVPRLEFVDDPIWQFRPEGMEPTGDATQPQQRLGLGDSCICPASNGVEEAQNQLQNQPQDQAYGPADNAQPSNEGGDVDAADCICPQTTQEIPQNTEVEPPPSRGAQASTEPIDRNSILPLSESMKSTLTRAAQYRNEWAKSRREDRIERNRQRMLSEHARALGQDPQGGVMEEE